MLDKLFPCSELAAGVAGLSPALKELLAALMKASFNDVPSSMKTYDPGLMAELLAQRLSPWVYRRLYDHNLENAISPELRHGLKQGYAAALKISARQDRETHLLIQSLASAGVEVILLKGADLRQRVYNDPATRPMTDLDLLISPGDKVRTESILTDMGYRLSPQCVDPWPGFRERFRRELHFDPPRGSVLLVDLHWQLDYVDGFYHLPYPRLREAAVPYEYQGVPVRGLSPDHLLTHLALHVWDEFHGAQQILDFPLALRLLPPDWPHFLAEVSRFRCPVPVYLVLRKVCQIIPGLVPARVLEELARHSPTWAESLVLKRRLGYFTRHFALLYHRRRLEDWAFYVASLLWPRPEYLTAVYGRPDRAAFLRQFIATLFSSKKSWSLS